MDNFIFQAGVLVLNLPPGCVWKTPPHFWWRSLREVAAALDSGARLMG